MVSAPLLLGLGPVLAAVDKAGPNGSTPPGSQVCSSVRRVFIRVCGFVLIRTVDGVVEELAEQTAHWKKDQEWFDSARGRAVTKDLL